MSESVIDFAGLDSAAAAVATTEAPVVETTAVETPTTETPEAAVETTDKPAAKETKQQYNSDGSPKEDAAKTEEDPNEFGEKTPKEIRPALKAFRDASPANIAATKILHGAYERWEAAKAIYPGGVNEMRQAKEFADLVGGAEGYEKLTGSIAAAEASDAKLYDPTQNASLIEDVVADLKQQGKLSNLNTLTSAMMDAAKTNDEKGYQAALAPHLLGELERSNLPNTLSYLNQILAGPDPVKALEEAKAVAADMAAWYKGLDEKNKKAKENVVSPERKQLEDERAAFLKEQSDFKTTQTTEFKNSVAKVCEKTNNSILGADLGPFLKMPYFVGYGKENLMPLGNQIKADLYAALKSDAAYQAQMKSMWSAKQPDRAKIEEYHKARIQSVSKDIVRNAVQKMYPGYAKGGAAAGRVAAATAKKVVQTTAETKAVDTGKPLYVAVKPKDLDRTRKDATLLEITGKGYLPNGKFVTWRR